MLLMPFPAFRNLAEHASNPWVLGPSIVVTLLLALVMIIVHRREKK